VGLGATLPSGLSAASRSPFSSSHHHTLNHHPPTTSALHQPTSSTTALHPLNSRASPPRLSNPRVPLTTCDALSPRQRAPLSSPVAPSSKRLAFALHLLSPRLLDTSALYPHTRSTKYYHSSTTHQHVVKQDGAEPRRHPQGQPAHPRPWP
jgi:hypothetical protein